MRRRNLLFGGLALAASQAAAAASPVVLELFTSQGCSSCPAADTLLGELSQQPAIIALAWHVDYWNNQAWHDPYAKSDYTDRQRAYARRLGEEVYTPALVVNGAMMVAGSDRTSVLAALAQAAPLPVTVSAARTGTTLALNIGRTDGAHAALVAGYEPVKTTPIRGGENAGRVLREDRIVRDIRMIPAQNGRIDLPSVSPRQGIAVLLQDDRGRIIGAAEAGSLDA